MIYRFTWEHKQNDIFNLIQRFRWGLNNADAMGNSPHNTEGSNTATTDLEKVATKRIEKDKAVQEAYSKFTKILKTRLLHKELPGYLNTQYTFRYFEFNNF